MMSKGEEIILPEKKTMDVAGEEISVSKLSLGQLIELGRVVASAIAQIGEKNPDELLVRMQTGQSSQAEDILAMLNTLDEDHLARLLSILVQKPKSWVKKNVDVGVALDVLIAQNEVQPLGDIWGKVMTLVGSFKAKKSPE